MKATIDADTCTGCGLCCDTCPEVFQMDDSVAKVLLDPVPDTLLATCKEAAEGCPVEAIKLS
jgi:ferredoxin